jgi:cyclopropane-fatty-acyl-phospholipid synthase
MVSKGKVTMHTLTVSGEAPPFPAYGSDLEKRLVARLFARMAPKGGLRLDFGPGDSITVGQPDTPLAIAPPRLATLLAIIAQPDPIAGDSYVNGDWFVTDGDLRDVLALFSSQREGLIGGWRGRTLHWRTPRFLLRHLLFPLRSRRSLYEHYNLDRDFYRAFLGESMVYSCAFWDDNTTTLEQAQDNKLRTVIERARIEPGHHVLDIGCGWGQLARTIVRLRGAHVSGVTVTPEQCRTAQDEADRMPDDIGKKLSFHLTDYRDFHAGESDLFDRIVSVGMFEHLGLGQYRHYFDAIRRLLKPGGRAVIHSIVRPRRGRTDEWIHRNIFPGGYIPAISEMLRPAEVSGLNIEAVHVHEGENYRLTLNHWRQRFYEAWPRLKQGNRDARFFRLWDFYLAASESSFLPQVSNFKVAHLVLRK